MVLFGWGVAGFHTRLQSWLATLNSTLQERRHHEQAERHHEQQHQHQ